MPKHLYQRPNSPNWWFEIKVPEDVQDKLGKRRIRRSTKTDSLKKATRLANIWAEEVWDEIEKARSPDWDYHRMKAGIQDLQNEGLSSDEIDDIALQVIDDNDQYLAYERAANKIVVLMDHLEDYLSWCERKGNSVKTVRAKRVMLRQFCERFRLLEDVTEYNIRKWAADRDIKGSTQKSIKNFAKDFFKYLGQEVLFRKLDVDVLEGLKTKAVNSRHKEVITGRLFHELLETAENRDVLMLFGHTGRRSIALANLSCDDIIEFEGIKCFRFRIDKSRRPETHKPQVIPIHPKLIGIVDRLVRDSKDGYLIPLNAEGIEARSEALREKVSRSGKVSSHQFRASVITMLHNQPVGLTEKAIRSVVGHSIGQDEHIKSYMAGLKPSVLLPAVTAIDWDGWEWP